MSNRRCTSLEETTISVKTNRLDPLDALRALAIFLVFALHVTLFTGLPITMDVFILFLPAWAGVWIFFVLSGYLIGKGFKTKRYENKIEYLKKRFVRICIPYYVFIFTVVLLLSPGLVVNDPVTILRILTFTYNGMPGEVAYGATWFISTLMQFYIISIFFEMLVRKIEKNKHACKVLFISIFISGLILRQFLLTMNYHWELHVYTPSLTNLDLFFCGFLLSGIIKREGGGEGVDAQRKQKILASISAILILSVIVFFAYCQVVGQTAAGYSIFYMYRGQSIIILTTCLYIYCLDRSVRKNNERLSMSAIKRNPFRIIECFAVISLGFYLWHSIILNQVAIAFQPHPTIIDHLITMAVAGILSVVMAIIFYYSVEKWAIRILRGSKD
jgi:peptidoglycan/LPS O-acetylase OafA/YrhL